MPDHASEPPHCSATFNSDAGQGVRTASFATGSMARTFSMPSSMVRRSPATSWMFMVWNIGPRVMPKASSSQSIWFISQPKPTISTPAWFGWRA